MPVEPFDATDENGVRVTGTAEAYRDRNGAYYDPSSPFYHNPRFSDHAIDYLNTRDVCRINRDVLSQAVQKAFQFALIRLGIEKPEDEAVSRDVNNWIAETLRQCALNPDKYASNQSPSFVDTRSGMFASEQARNSSNSGAQPASLAATQETAFPLEALLSTNRARKLDDWASSPPRGPIDRSALSSSTLPPEANAPAPARYLSSYRVRS